jgi:ABC-type Zn uptake system ZnuABC Zn-binding protein ZnuA
VEAAEAVVISGGGLEEFMHDVLHDSAAIDASRGIGLLGCEEHHDHGDGHHHDADPHLWLSPAHAKMMAQNICAALQKRYPDHKSTFSANLEGLLADLDALQSYGEETLSDLSCRELITFHDGFAYFARSFDLVILRAIEEESGREASAAELKELICLVQAHHPGLFTEVSGSATAAQVIARETGCDLYQLDMAMSGDSYFDAMYRNIDAVKEALG